ncbi:uncharacterized protein EI90DRAFT_713325 [Cantharellus anzutake]|uniref:uncharacterized protein n=1 Tax=Cantharellus anzutake TaxID=1750568 RepID=UPI001907D4AD|nr:uncharacterized protein EI90DRAFT_713325 [Cantharellus anzutake]KAF8332843.1 hypothetical protein EI90DRAFT_713325 [Cantharellus anzutake]
MAFVLKTSLFYLCLLFVRGGLAQGFSLVTTARNSSQLFGTSTVQCQPGYDWASNSLGQNPCLIAAFLTGACGNGDGEVRSLTPFCEPYNSPIDNSGLDTSQCAFSIVLPLLSPCSQHLASERCLFICSLQPDRCVCWLSGRTLCQMEQLFLLLSHFLHYGGKCSRFTS